MTLLTACAHDVDIQNTLSNNFEELTHLTSSFDSMPSVRNLGRLLLLCLTEVVDQSEPRPMS